MLQVLEALPGISNCGSFIASMTSVTFKERSRVAYKNLIYKLVPGELSPAHLFFHPDYAESLSTIKMYTLRLM